MTPEMSTRKKFTICATVSPYLKKRVDELVADNKFSSMSDCVTQSLAEFIARYDERETKRETPPEICLLEELVDILEAKKRAPQAANQNAPAIVTHKYK